MKYSKQNENTKYKIQNTDTKELSGTHSSAMSCRVAYKVIQIYKQGKKTADHDKTEYIKQKLVFYFSFSYVWFFQHNF